jgi:hypothetical protein
MRPALLTAALLLALAACGDRDSAAPSDPIDTLSAADAYDAFEALMGATTALYQFRISSAPGVSTQTIDDTRACPLGGTLRTQGTAITDQPAGLFTGDVRQTHRACVTTSEAGRRWQFEGDPDLRIVATFGLNTGAATVQMTGRVRVQHDTTRAICNTDLQLTGTPAGDVTVSGRFCGQVIALAF